MILATSAMLLATAWTAVAGPVTAVDLAGLDEPTRLLAASAQALLNSDGPRAFLLWDGNCERWLEWDRARFGLDVRRGGLADLVKAAAKAGGYVLWDPDFQDTALVGCTIAGAEGLLLATSDHETALQGLGLKCAHDLRTRFAGQTRAQIYRWLFENYRDRCNRSYLHNSTVRSRLELDVTEYVGEGGLRLRFEDETKEDGLGAKLRGLTVRVDGEVVADFRVFTDAEKPYLIDADGSWPDHENDRIADRDQHFTYELRVPEGARVTAAVMVTNGYLVKAAGLGSEDYREVARPRSRANDPGLQTPSFDIAMALKCLSVNLSADPRDEDEYAVRDEIQKWLEPPACLLGWHTERDGEGRYVADASDHGHFVICTGAPNLSFHRHLRPEEPARPRLAAPPALDPSRVYVSFTLSDGDALWCDYCFQGDNWLSERRGRVPFGWELQPLLKDLAPDILAYYVEGATDADCLVGAFAAGYNHPNRMSEADLERYLGYAHGVLADTGFRLCTVLCDRTALRELAQRFDARLGDLIIGEEEGYGGMEGPDLVLPRLLWLRARLPRQGRMQAEQLIEDIEALAKRSPQRPLFLPGHLHLPLAGHLETVGRVMRELDSTRFEVVRPDELFQLARQWYDEHPIVTLPEELVVAEGLEQSLRAAVDNTTGRELTISFDAPGLRDRPVEAKVGARSEQAVLLRWDRVEGDAIELRVSYARQAETHRLVVRRLELPARVVEGATRAEVVRILDAVDMNHRFGQAESLPGTWAPRAFVARARPGEAQEGHIVFGGYEALDPGRYLVIYRLQSLAAGRGLVARLDVASGYGKTIAAARELGAQDLPVGRWTAVPLGFSADGVLEASECRVEWLGGGPLAVDRIYVLRLE